MTKPLFRSLLVLVLLSSLPANASEEIRFDISATQTCLVEKKAAGRKECIGVSANICIDTKVGGTTVGMGFCLNQELEWWDARLNSVYREYLAKEKADDAEYQKDSFAPPPKAPALVELQRAWIKYRDALCEQVAVQWGNGTGRGPAFMSCMMSETGRQTLLLEDGLNWADR